MGLKINENKTKYMLMTKYPAPFQNLNVHQFSFEQVENFKYLDANINHKNNMHNEIKNKIMWQTKSTTQWIKWLHQNFFQETWKKNYTLPT